MEIRERDKNLEKGVKEKSDKLYYEIDWDFIKAMAERMSENKYKYEKFNWKKKIDIDEIKQALFRHVIEVMQDNYKDGESEIGHITAIANNAMILYYHGKK